MALLRSLIFTTWMFGSLPFFATAVIFAGPLPYRYRYKIAIAWVTSVMFALEHLCGLTYTVEGRENIPDVPGIAMLKHSSAMETLVDLLLFPKQTWALKRELMWLPFFGWGTALLKPIAVRRGGGHSAVNQLARMGSERLAEGLWVMIFPEGTRTPPGMAGRYGVGGAVLALRSGAQIVPVAHNAGDFWPRRGWVKKPGTVRFIIGPPISPDGLDARQITAKVKDWIESNVEEIRSEAALSA